MLHLKSCPRCHGDLREDTDWDGDSRRCFQCGYIDYVKAPQVDRTWDALYAEAEQLPMVLA